MKVCRGGGLNKRKPNLGVRRVQSSTAGYVVPICCPISQLSHSLLQHLRASKVTLGTGQDTGRAGRGLHSAWGGDAGAGQAEMPWGHALCIPRVAGGQGQVPTTPAQDGEGAASAGAGTGPKAISVAARGSSCFEHGESSPQAPSGCPGTVLQGSLPARAQHHPPTRTCSPPAHRGSHPAAAFPMGHIRHVRAWGRARRPPARRGSLAAGGQEIKASKEGFVLLSS